ncbi:bifunctional sulfate adenylyltransferase/adenylylsulfate kinase [Candidatus Gottesmanbacteria bacterium]|nr:bifunctional sulfate adenylyltransferase/adenylylsulfate kinase [Candidatus Gottesmanbacteria bacterium]
MKNFQTTPSLITPYGGELISLVVAQEKRAELLTRAIDLPSHHLSERSLQDLELLACGAFSPLSTFMSQSDYLAVIESMRLSNGMLFPIPITLPLSNDRSILKHKEITLRNQFNEIVAVMSIQDVYLRNFKKECQLVYQTTDPTHPMVSEMSHWPDYCVSGPIQVINPPRHYNFLNLRRTPASLRVTLEARGNKNVVAFQTRNPMHRAHEELCKRAAEKVRGTLLIHPTVGMTKIDDIPYITRVQIYAAMYNKYFPHDKTVLSILPLAMRFAGPREAVWHAIIRRNYGANHFIVGRNHASPGVNAHGKQFYSPDAAQQLMQGAAIEIGVTPVLFDELGYDQIRKAYREIRIHSDKTTLSALSGTDVRNVYLAGRKKLPGWFTRPEVANILADSYVPLHKKGFCVWLTGLPCAGKTTIATILQSLIQESGREASLLDGDVVRTLLSKGLGYTKEDRDTNVLRIGFVASEIVRHNGVVICAAISPYEQTRQRVRRLMAPGSFMLMYVDTPITTCEARDTKGYYQQAKSHKINHFTGINDAYEQPLAPEVHLNTFEKTPQKCAGIIFNYLITCGLIAK